MFLVLFFKKNHIGVFVEASQSQCFWVLFFKKNNIDLLVVSKVLY
jgi:hypothetical protein